MSDAFRFACPVCKTPLTRLNADKLRCPADGGLYSRQEGIWRFITPQQRLDYRQFIQEYEAVRSAEGRGSTDPAYYRELPFKDLSGRFSSDWKIRSQSYRALLHTVVAPLEKEAKRSLKILDLGAGNGWLSNRLAQRGHLAAAVDLQTNTMDGLGAYINYEAGFVTIQSDFHSLPFVENQVDLAIFNASLHYSTSYTASLCEALRVVRPGGQIVILDSPIYRDSRSGEEMVREREQRFQSAYGFASNALPSENYLTYSRLEELGSRINIRWRLVSVHYGLGWALRPLRARLTGRREPAQFRIVVGTKD